MATFLLSVMGAFVEFERALIRERQREGITLARKAAAQHSPAQPRKINPPVQKTFENDTRPLKQTWRSPHLQEDRAL